MLFAVETSEMLLLDAMEDAPTLYAVLTAREHLTRAEATVELRHLRRVLRRRWSTVRWAITVEFQRRGALHLNLLVKGVPVEHHDEFHALLVETWCARVDALPTSQWSDVINDGKGVVKYLSLHFLKATQAPAIGWRGHRYSAMRDYLVRPAAVMREEAKRSLRIKRLLHTGMSAEAAERELVNAPAFELWRDPSMPLGAAPARRPGAIFIPDGAPRAVTRPGRDIQHGGDPRPIQPTR